MSKSIEFANDGIYYEKNKYHPRGQFYLPHSCDEWVIGDLEDAKEFVESLSELIEKVEAQS